MDAFEQIAHDLEVAQTKRFNASTKSSDFWDDREKFVFEHIKTTRQLSTTFNPIIYTK